MASDEIMEAADAVDACVGADSSGVVMDR